jgi:hypothetical protein
VPYMVQGARRRMARRDKRAKEALKREWRNRGLLA